MGVLQTDLYRLALFLEDVSLGDGVMVGRLASIDDNLITRLQIFCTATAVNGVDEDGFQTMVSPHTAARAAFHDHTATGKLKAEMMPTTPIGCHCSYMRWRGRSDIMVGP